MRGPHQGWSEVRQVATARFDRLEREALDLEVRLEGLIASIDPRISRADDGPREIASVKPQQADTSSPGRAPGYTDPRGTR